MIINDEEDGAEMEDDPFMAMFKEDTEKEFADWNPGMDVWTAGLGGLNASTFSKLIRIITCLLGIFETYSYIYTLNNYLQHKDYIWFSLSLVSLVIYTCYVTFHAISKASHLEWRCGGLFGLILGLLQLGQPYLVFDCLSGTSSITSSPAFITLQKIDVFKIGVFSMPQAILQLYIFLGQHRDALPVIHTIKDLNTIRPLFSICSSMFTISYTLCQLYKTRSSGIAYMTGAFIFSWSSTVLRITLYCSLAIVFKWFVFVLFALGFIVRCFISHPRPGDPYANKFVYIFSALIFSFIINIDPNVPFLPVLLMANIETIIAFGLSILWPKKFEIPEIMQQFFVSNYTLLEYFDKILLVAIGLLVVMNISSLVLNYRLKHTHIANLVSLYHRYGNKLDKDEYNHPNRLPTRYREYVKKTSLQTAPELRRYNWKPAPVAMVQYRQPSYGKGVETLTKQFRVNPRCSELLQYRSQKLMETGQFQEAVADCTFGLNPYFGLHYQDVGITFNRLFYSPKVMPNFRKFDGTDPHICGHLINRIACLIDLEELTLASLDRRRLAIAAKIQGNTELVKICKTEPFPNSDNTKHLQLDHLITNLAV